eukprot:NODE_17_length_48642_cov_1.199349.p41 type:complete len:114 gc:universal NODE_17_length_48642_cov_1.199349:47933-47592(-)
MKLTVRVIKNFEYRTIKSIVLDIDGTSNINFLKKKIMELLPKKFDGNYDTVKIYFIPHAFKTQNLVINLDDDSSMILSDDIVLSSRLKDDCELSFFNYQSYLTFKKQPNFIKW